MVTYLVARSFHPDWGEIFATEPASVDDEERDEPDEGNERE